MTDKEFKRLKRSQLIEIIYELQLEQKNLQEEKDAMEQRFLQEKEVLQEQLDDRQSKIENAGSIAEAACALNDIFEVAQKTAEQYLSEIKETNLQSEQKSQETLSQAQKEAERLVACAKKESEEIRRQTEEEIRDQWEEFQKKVTEVLKADSRLEKFLEQCKK